MPKTVAKTEDIDMPDMFDRNQLTYADLIGDSLTDTIQGAELLSDELFDALVGVPFVITKLVFRQGTSRGGEMASYVSCEAITGDEKAMKKRRVSLDDLPFTPGDLVVFNDGSTGIYRQTVGYLWAKGWVTLPEPIIRDGKMGQSTFDLCANKWLGTSGVIELNDNGHRDVTFHVRINCPRGIRLSDYQNEFTKDGKTRYLA